MKVGIIFPYFDFYFITSYYCRCSCDMVRDHNIVLIMALSRAFYAPFSISAFYLTITVSWTCGRSNKSRSTTKDEHNRTQPKVIKQHCPPTTWYLLFLYRPVLWNPTRHPALHSAHTLKRSSLLISNRSSRDNKRCIIDCWKHLRGSTTTHTKHLESNNVSFSFFSAHIGLLLSPNF